MSKDVHTYTLTCDGVLGGLGLSAFRRLGQALFIGRAADRLEIVLMVLHRHLPAPGTSAVTQAVMSVGVGVGVGVDTGYELGKVRV